MQPMDNRSQPTNDGVWFQFGVLGPATSAGNRLELGGSIHSGVPEFIVNGCFGHGGVKFSHKSKS
jgi:hypothetical protein